MRTMNYLKRQNKNILVLIISLSVGFNMYSQMDDSAAPHLTSYEEPGNNEMVNLNTGDFTYNIPLFDVPSPEGSFPLNIFYHAGIKTNQIASQVGLGWGLNPGCINRFSVGYPDDFCYDFNALDEYPFGPLNTTEIRIHEYNKGFTNTSANLDLGLIFPGCPSLQYSYNTNSNTGNHGEIKFSLGPSLPEFITGRGSSIPELGKSDWKSEVVGGWYIPGIFSTTTTRYSLDNLEYKVPFGSLYLNQYLPYWDATDNKIGGDMDIFTDLNIRNVGMDVGLTHIAYDSYVVNAPSISGNIRPSIFENGTLVSSSEIYNFSDLNKFNRIEYYSHYTNNKPSNVRFRYQNENAGNVKMNSGYIYLSDPLDDPTILKYPKIASETTNFFTPPAENEANGFKNNYLIGQKFVEWFVYKELEGNGSSIYNANLPLNIGALDRGAETTMENNFRRVRIHAFKITNESGYTYHFGLPVWAKDLKMKVFPGFNGNGSENNDENYSYVETSQLPEFAYTWLLTSITGPDYVDANENAITDKDDYGYWVKFEYGKLTDSYTWRSPQNGYLKDMPGRDRHNQLYKGNKYYNTGSKQLYYLNKIKTRSHSAIFLYSERNDIISTNSVKQLKNDQIILFQNDDLNYLEDNYILKNGNFYSTDVFNSLSQAVIDQISNKTIKKVNFRYTYDLCKNPLGQGGKLTLKNISFFGKNNSGEQPPYSFDYYENTGKNPAYIQNAYDRWGYYKSDHVLSYKYVTDISKNNVDAWSLRSITTPVGANINITYESDDFAKIATSNFISENRRYGGGIRVKELATNFNGGIFKNVYNYVADDNTHSSGVIVAEPPSFDLDVPLNAPTGEPTYRNPAAAFDISVSGVMYQKVRIQKYGNNQLESYSDFYFEPFELSKHVNRVQSSSSQYYSYKVITHNFQQNVGRLLKVNNYNNINQLGSSKELIYKDFTTLTDPQSSPGVRTEVSHSAKKNCYTVTGTCNHFFLSVNEQVIYPSVLQKVVETNNNLSASVEFEYDKNTGLVTSKTVKASNNAENKELTLYAHTVNPEMSSKVFNPENKNLLTPVSAQLSLTKIGDEWKVYDASVNTWKSTWNYRIFNSSDNQFYNSYYTDFLPVYRPYKLFQWRGNLANTGIFNSTIFDDRYNTIDKMIANWSDFNSNGTNGWVKANENKLYDHYSRVLESSDIYNKYTASKYSKYGNNIISADNSNHKEIAFCDAEDELTEFKYFNGEILFLNGTSYVNDNMSFVHSGKKSLKLDYSGPSLQYSQICGTEGIKTNRKYSVSTWVYEINAGAVAYKIEYFNNNGVIHTINKPIITTECFKAGSWLLFNYNLPTSSENSLITNADRIKISVLNTTNNSTSSYIDDFSFTPLDIESIKNVFDNKTDNLVASLNNENITTKFEYNDVGQLENTFKETTLGFKRISHHNTNFKQNLYVIDFLYSPNSPKLNQDITFTAVDAGSDAIYNWNFGDGTTGTGRNVNHSYISNNSPTVTLNVIKANGNSFFTSKNVIIPYIKIISPAEGATINMNNGLDIIWETNAIEGSVNVNFATYWYADISNVAIKNCYVENFNNFDSDVWGTLFITLYDRYNQIIAYDEVMVFFDR